MNFLTAAAENVVDLENISLTNASIVAVLGYAVVFFGLILLMTVIIVMGKAFTARDKKAETEVRSAIPLPTVPSAPAAPVAEPQASADLAPGSAGQLKLYDTPPKTAAMLMAIVAYKMNKPLNELRFISIKEVK